MKDCTDDFHDYIVEWFLDTEFVDEHSMDEFSELLEKEYYDLINKRLNNERKGLDEDLANKIFNSFEKRRGKGVFKKHEKIFFTLEERRESLNNRPLLLQDLTGITQDIIIRTLRENVENVISAIQQGYIKTDELGDRRIIFQSSEPANLNENQTSSMIRLHSTVGEITVDIDMRNRRINGIVWREDSNNMTIETRITWKD
ncbi:hypothetical protein RclHR1_05790011 [Rhizophagus clarus]|uniref:Uncharacterized protein n=1 Tax=Rhizophagus clarus TaxID=94130 RepID=A0A2Z6S649_9GLOM|nr:hypothetical protein RclHR1_05790011 [Rhizophagus clarus]